MLANKQFIISYYAATHYKVIVNKKMFIEIF